MWILGLKGFTPRLLPVTNNPLSGYIGVKIQGEVNYMKQETSHLGYSDM